MFSRRAAALNPLLFLFCCGCLFAVAAAGCQKSGPKMVQVEGKVTLGGKPVPRGWVTFHPDAKKGNQSMEVPNGTIEDGDYHVITRVNEGITPGWYHVAVNAAEQIDPKNPYINKWLVPEKYANPKTSKLQMQVVENPAPGAYDINLEPK
jgi:hypothetical protein